MRTRRPRTAPQPPAEPTREAIQALEDRISARLDETRRAETQVVAARDQADRVLAGAHDEAAREAGRVEAELVGQAEADAQRRLERATAQARRIAATAQGRREEDVAAVLAIVLGGAR